MRKDSLATKVILFLLLVIFTAAAGTGYISYITSYNSLKNQVINDLALTVETTESYILEYFERRSKRIADFAADGFILETLKTVSIDKKDELKETLKSYLILNKLPLDPNIADLEIIDKNGEMMTTTNPSVNTLMTENPSEYKLMKEQIDKNNIYISNIFKSVRFSKEDSGFFVAVPINDPSSHNRLGALIGFINIQELNDILSGRDKLKLGVVPKESIELPTLDSYLVNQEGFLISQAKRENSGILKHRVSSLPVTNCVQKKEPISAEYQNYSGAMVVGASRCLLNGWVLVNEIGIDEAFNSLDVIKTRMALFVIIYGAIVFLLAYFFIKQVVRRIEKLADLVKKVGEGNLDIKFESRSTDEISDLGFTFNEMARKLKNSYADLNAKAEQIELQNRSLKDNKVEILNLLQRIQAEKVKTDQEKIKIEAILSSIGDGVFVTDNLGRVIIANSIALNLAGYTGEEVLNRSYTQVFKFVLDEDPTVQINSFVEEVLKTGTIKNLVNHTLLVRKDGSTIPVADSAALVKDFQGNISGCVVVFRDVTHQREIEQTKDNFLSTAAHQLRTPLGSIRWNLEMLLSGDIGELPNNIQEIIQQVYESDQRLIELVNDLLNVSRIDQGRLTNTPKSTVVADIVQSVIKELHPEIQKRSLSVNLNLDTNLSSVIVDPKLFYEVVTNLVANAIKYNKKDGIVNIKTYQKDDYLYIEISDTGIGIRAKDQSQLFSKFFRAENAVRSETEGTGLGLFVAKSYIESWGGQIKFVSEENKGSTFIIILPTSKL